MSTSTQQGEKGSKCRKDRRNLFVLIKSWLKIYLYKDESLSVKNIVKRGRLFFKSSYKYYLRKEDIIYLICCDCNFHYFCTFLFIIVLEPIKRGYSIVMVKQKWIDELSSFPTLCMSGARPQVTFLMEWSHHPHVRHVEVRRLHLGSVLFELERVW